MAAVATPRPRPPRAGTSARRPVRDLRTFWRRTLAVIDPGADGRAGGRDGRRAVPVGWQSQRDDRRRRGRPGRRAGLALAVDDLRARRGAGHHGGALDRPAGRAEADPRRRRCSCCSGSAPAVPDSDLAAVRRRATRPRPGAGPARWTTRSGRIRPSASRRCCSCSVRRHRVSSCWASRCGGPASCRLGSGIVLAVSGPAPPVHAGRQRRRRGLVGHDGDRVRGCVRRTVADARRRLRSATGRQRSSTAAANTGPRTAWRWLLALAAVPVAVFVAVFRYLMPVQTTRTRPG